MAEPSEDTKKTATSMMSGVGKSFLGGAKKVVSSVGKLFTKKPDSIVPPSQVSNPTEALGEIFKIMKVMDEERKISQEKTNAYIEEQKHEKDRRNEEIIKALTSRKPPKPPKPKKEKAEEKKAPEKKVEEKKVEEKKAPEKKEPEKKPEDKAARDKADREAREKADKDKADKAAKDKADKEAKDKADRAAKDKADKEARETAERIKKEEEAKKARETAERIKKEEAKKAQEASATSVTKPPVIPSATTTTTTAGKAAIGASALGSTASAIGGAESGGNYNMTFGDSLDKKGNIIRGQNLSPEKKFNGRNLTDLTLEEVDILGKERNKNSPSTSAMGKYQFMNSTLFGQWRKDKNGKSYLAEGLVQILAKEKKADLQTFMKETIFSPDLQETFNKMLHEQDIATMKRLGVPITPGYEYMAHYIGATGAKAVYDRRNTDMTVQQALIDAGLPDPVHGKTNKELSEKKASEFESILAGRLKSHGLTPHASNTSGDKMNDMSKTNTDMKKEMNAQQATQNQQNINVVNQNTTEQQNTPPKQKDTNPLLAKGQAK